MTDEADVRDRMTALEQRLADVEVAVVALLPPIEEEPNELEAARRRLAARARARRTA